jgi:hypothetical protein
MMAGETVSGLGDQRETGVSGFAMIAMQLAAAVTLLATCLAASFGATCGIAGGMLPVLVVHAWCVRVPGALSILIVFLAGLWVDVLSHGPFGFWAMAYVVAALTSDALTSVGRRGGAGQVVSITVTLIVVVGLLWGSASAYSWRLVPGAQLATAGLQAGLVYLVVVGIMAGLSMLVRRVFGRRANTLREAWP